METIDLFEVLVREHSPMLMTFIRAGVRDDAIADDIWQETMITAWRKMDDFDRARPFAAWLRGIAVKHMLAQRRKSARDHQFCDAATLEYFDQRLSQIDQLNGDTFEEKLHALRECIDALPDQYHQSIRLRYGDLIKPQQMARQLGVAVETVKKRLARAKIRLHDCIDRKLAEING